MLSWIFAIGLAIFVSSESFAATITSSVSKEGKTVISLDGEIAPGDAERIKSIIKASNDSGRMVSGIRLNSVGGNLLEGVVLAELIRFAKIATVVANGAKCASACFVAFAAGADKFASHSAQVGVHGASDQSGRETALSGAATVGMARVVKELGVPAGIIGKMVVTPPTEIVWLSPNDLRAMGTTMTGNPAQVKTEQSTTSQLSPESLSGVQALASPQTSATTWRDIVTKALEASAAQNRGRAIVSRACQPELKTCSVAVFYRTKSQVEVMLRNTEDMTGNVVRREACEFNRHGDIRLCMDWDSGTTRRDMKNIHGEWHAVGAE